MLELYMDLDDTLIQTQMLFEKYKRACANFILMEVKEKTINYEDIMNYFNEREVKNIEIHGFKNKRFILSWEETYRHFHPDGVSEKSVGRLAETVFYHASPLMDGAIDALEALTKKGYEITIITVGVEAVQNRRIDQAGIRDYFKDIYIVPYKDKDIFDAIIKDKDNSVMIGNSMRSDIAPALELGVRAIQINAPNWFYDELEEAPEGKYDICNIEEVPAFIEQYERNKLTVGKN